MQNRVASYPAAYANWASLALNSKPDQKVIAVVGKRCTSVIQKIKAKNISGVMIFGSENESQLPYFANRYVEGKTLIYICSGTHCLVPVETVEDAILLLASRRA